MRDVGPRIGVTWCGDAAKQLVYERAVAAAGAVVQRILPDASGDAASILSSVDGVLLTGGDDVDPGRYGQPVNDDASLHQRVKIDAARDALEIPLARAALEGDVPLLAICRGIQVLNVAAGGDLVQDTTLLGLPAEAHDQARRRPRPAADAAVHAVRVLAGSRVAAIADEAEVGVNSFHHQALGRIAAGFSVTAVAADGVVEVIEGQAQAFAVGVQWHPERMTDTHAEQRGLFAAFVRAAEAGRRRA